MALDATGTHQSSLRVSIKPQQSSFFAGEEFICTITFTNTNPKVTHTQPIPQTSTFSSDPFSDSDNDPRPRHNGDRTPFPHRRVVSSAPFRNAHAKSKSVDVRSLLTSQPPSDPSSSSEQPLQSRPNGPKANRAKALLRHLDGHVMPERKRLIGVPASDAPSSPIPHSAWLFPTNVAPPAPQHSKSTSVSISRGSERTGLGLGLPPQPQHQPRLPSPSTSPAHIDRKDPQSPFDSKHGPESQDTTPTKSRMSSLNIARKASSVISSKHPHSRKKSVVQTQAEDLTEAFELDTDSKAATLNSGSEPSTPIGSRSVSDLNRLDSQSDFYRLGKNDTMESVFRDSFTDWSQGMRRQSISSQGASSPLYPSADVIPPGSEKILWSFAQLSGSVEVDESLIKPGDFENLKRRLAYGDVSGSGSTTGPSPSSSRTLGGGHLGHDDDPSRTGRVGWSGYLRHALSPSRSTMLGGHRRTGSTLQENTDRTLQSRSVPTFSTPPSIIAVDLVLAPGESKSYTFSIRLPVDLPPSYHGKAIRFHYHLSLGTNRRDTTGITKQSQKSRLIQVPVRIYNYVAASGVRPFYDLMNPVILLREQGLVKALDDGEEDTSSGAKQVTTASRFSAHQAKDNHHIKRSDLDQYVREQLVTSESRSEGESSSQTLNGGKAPSDPFTSRTNSDESCKAAVELLSRSSSKVSYDISKDGRVAAVLTLVKSRFRLGDTIMGVISINDKDALARIARVAATLETYEEVQPTIALLPTGRMQRLTKVVHAEFHESTLDKGRATFSLPIPSGATPDFVTSGVKLNWTVRLSFLTIARTKGSEAAPRPPPPNHLVPASSDGFSLYHTSLRALPSLAGPLPRHLNDPGVQDLETKLETVECAVPVTVLPNSTGFKVGAAEFFA